MSRLNVWCCVSPILRQGAATLGILCVPFCRTCGKTGMPAAVSLLYFYIVTDANTSHPSRCLRACQTHHVNMFLEVFKSTLLSPSSDTRSYATHVCEPCHTARIQLKLLSLHEHAGSGGTCRGPPHGCPSAMVRKIKNLM